MEKDLVIVQHGQLLTLYTELSSNAVFKRPRIPPERFTSKAAMLSRD